MEKHLREKKISRYCCASILRLSVILWHNIRLRRETVVSIGVCVCVHTCSVYMCFIVLNTWSVCHLLYILVLIQNKSHFICLKYGTDTFCSLVMHVCCFKFNNMWKQEDDLSLLDSESQRSICLYLEKKNDSGFRSSVELFSSHLHFAITSYWHKKRKWPPRQSQSVIQMIIFFKSSQSFYLLAALATDFRRRS